MGKIFMMSHLVIDAYHSYIFFKFIKMSPLLPLLCNNETAYLFFISSTIRQKGESEKGCYKKTKQSKFPQNEHFLPPDTHTHVFL